MLPFLDSREPLFLVPQKASPTMVCLLYLYIIAACAKSFVVVGFTSFASSLHKIDASTTSRLSVNLLPVAHDTTHPILATSPLSILRVERDGLLKANERTHPGSGLQSVYASPLSPSTTVLLAEALSLENNSQDDTFKGEKDEKQIFVGTNKKNFFASLDTIDTLNDATKERSALLAKMIDEKTVVPAGETPSASAQTSPPSSTIPTYSYEKPGSTETFLTAARHNSEPVAAGKWKVIYAPHMTTAMNLFGGTFDVSYDLFPDQTMVSHARYDFPIVGKGYLSVSGTYGSLRDDDTNTYSRVDFDKAWIKVLNNGDDDDTRSAVPYQSLEEVPDSFLKTTINEVGKRAFIESVAVFPVSFLDDDTIVFEFEFLGTKICAHKIT